MNDIEFRNHIVHYLVLLIGLLACLLLFYFYRYHPVAKMYIAFVGTFFYAAWGVVHHYLEDRVSAKVVVEYVALALFVFIGLLVLIMF